MAMVIEVATEGGGGRRQWVIKSGVTVKAAATDDEDQ